MRGPWSASCCTRSTGSRRVRTSDPPSPGAEVVAVRRRPAARGERTGPGSWPEDGTTEAAAAGPMKTSPSPERTFEQVYKRPIRRSARTGSHDCRREARQGWSGAGPCPSSPQTAERSGSGRAGERGTFRQHAECSHRRLGSVLPWACWSRRGVAVPPLVSPHRADRRQGSLCRSCIRHIGLWSGPRIGTPEVSGQEPTSSDGFGSCVSKRRRRRPECQLLRAR